MISPTDINADLIDQILDDLHQRPQIDADKQTGIHLRLDALLIDTAQNLTLARWDERTSLNRAQGLLTRKLRVLQDILISYVTHVTDRHISEPLNLAAAEAFAKSERPNFISTTPHSTIGFTSPTQHLERIDAGIKDLKDVLTYARPILGEDLASLLQYSIEMQATLEGFKMLFSEERISEPFRLVALDAYAASKRLYSLPTLANSKRSSHNPIERIEADLHAFRTVIDHFGNLADEFDKLDPHSPDGQDQYIWIMKEGDDLGCDARRYLAPYLQNRKAGGVGPDIKLVRQIADLYEYVFGRAFRINSSDNESHTRAVAKLEAEGFGTSTRSLRSGGLVQYGQGNAMQFACSVVRHLRLDSVIVPSPTSTDELGFDPLVHGEDERPTEYDAKKYDRSHGPRQLLRTAEEHGAFRKKLIHRIGDIWKHDRRRDRLR